MPLTDASEGFSGEGFSGEGFSGEGFSGLRQWSEPVIYDCLSGAYRRLLADDSLAHRLARLHARVWRALIAGDMQVFGVSRAALVAGLHDANLAPDPLPRVDAEIMAELVDVVESRYGRSPRTATAYRLAFGELARRLRPAVRAAA